MGDLRVQNHDWSAIGLFTIDVHGDQCSDCWVFQQETPLGMANEKIVFEGYQDSFTFRFANVPIDEHTTADGLPIITTGYHGDWVVPELTTPLEVDVTNRFPLVANRYIDTVWTCWVDGGRPATDTVTVTDGEHLRLPEIDVDFTLHGESMRGETPEGVRVDGQFLDLTTIDLSFRYEDHTDHTLCWEGEFQDLPSD